ncbi:pro-corazonin-like [Topomyia yanbarensis]|uniref:pro-corazonin-like n=1 Tax=Topomyia yanbarensis TaxID=2498891 RepID=UPI00273CEE9F|nr:pro-corazonin-like [Topomyia yanbarensis]
MKHICTTSLIVSLLIIFTDAQTFQYSRGWTNGKRSSAEPAGAAPGQVLIPRFNVALDKPNDKLLIQRFLKAPCDVRLATALINRNRDLMQQLSNDADAMAILYDSPSSSSSNGGSESGPSDELRFKRDIAVDQDNTGRLIRF